MEDGDEAVVFDRRSRQTHVLNPLATAALRILLDGPLGTDELRRRLGLSAGPAAGESDPAADVLATFDALGIVEPVRP